MVRETQVEGASATTATAGSATRPPHAGPAIFVALVSLVTLIFAFGFAVFLRVQPQSDLTIHLEYARRIHSTADLTSPHFLFQLLVKAVHTLQISYETAAAWVLGLCYGGMALLIAFEIEHRGGRLTPLRAFVIVPALLLASHIFLFTVRRPNLYYGYFAPIVYHNPTQQLNKLFALWIYFLYRSELLSSKQPSGRTVPALSALCVLSALAKPSFLLAFVPTAALYGVRDLVRRHWRHARIAAIGIVVPSALVLAWQAHMEFGAGAPARIAFAPFTTFDATETLYKLPASFAFPLVVAAAAVFSRQVDEGLRFVWILTVISLAATLTIVESGEYLLAGNFAWTGQTAAFLVYVESALLLMTRPVFPWRLPAWVVFGVHVACGIAWYAVMFSKSRPDWL